MHFIKDTNRIQVAFHVCAVFWHARSSVVGYLDDSNLSYIPLKLPRSQNKNKTTHRDEKKALLLFTSATSSLCRLKVNPRVVLAVVSEGDKQSYAITRS